MYKMSKRLWILGSRMAACMALVCSVQVANCQDQPPMPPTEMPAGPPPIETAPAIASEFAAIPSELLDRPFERFVDLKLLGEAYLTRDAGLMTDIALQLVEGERVLLRSHKGVKVTTVVDAAISVATDNYDVATLDRLSKVAEKLGDASITEQINAARVLASQTRAEQPEPPLPSDEMTHEELAEINHRMQMFERAKAVGDVASLKKLQEELKDQAAEEGSLPAFLAKQVADALAELPEADANTEAPETVELLNKLAGPARGLDPKRAVYLAQTSTGGLYVGSKLYQRDDNGNAYIHDPNGKAEYGKNMWTPERNPTAVKFIYGLALVSPNWQLSGDGSQYRAWVENNPDWCGKVTWNPATKKWDNVWIQTAQAPVFNLDVAGKKVNAIVGYAAPVLDLSLLVAAGGGNFSYQEVASLKGGANLTLANLVAAGGGNIIPPDSLFPQAMVIKAATMPGGFDLRNLVAAGGGNFTLGSISSRTSGLKILKIGGLVAAGGGNFHERLISVRDRLAAGNISQFLDPNFVKNLDPQGLAKLNAPLESTSIGTLLPGKLGTLVGNDGASLLPTYRLQSTGHFADAKKFSGR